MLLSSLNQHTSPETNFWLISEEFMMTNLKKQQILIDIDGTITYSIDEWIDDFKHSCVELMREKHHTLSEVSVNLIVEKAFELNNGLMEPVLAQLQLSPLECWQQVVKYFTRSISVFPDADFLLKELRKRNFAVYPATTNSSFAILAKLAVGGLATEMKTPYFKTVLGGSEVHPKGKSGPFFYRALMEKLKIKPEDVVMIGDNYKADAEFALEAGIKHIVIVDRSQVEDIRSDKNGVMVVHSLKHVIDKVCQHVWK